MNLFLKLDSFNGRYVCVSPVHSSVFFSPICPICMRYIQATLEGSNSWLWWLCICKQLYSLIIALFLVSLHIGNGWNKSYIYKQNVKIGYFILVHLLLFCTVTNKCTVKTQNITLLHVRTCPLILYQGTPRSPYYNRKGASATHWKETPWAQELIWTLREREKS
jgi:hypothetical protein